MSRIVLGWRLNQPVDDARVRRITAAIRQRYQPLFVDRLEAVGLWEGHQGLLHCDLPREADPGLEHTEDRICCLTGRPTVSGEEGSSETRPVSAAELHRRLVSAGGRFGRTPFARSIRRSPCAGSIVGRPDSG